MISDTSNLSRREALAALGLMALSCNTGLSAQSGTAAKKRPKGIAIQLYTVRDPAKKDLDGTLKKVRDMGWEYVQWSGMPNLPGDKIRAALDAAQLKAISAHVAIEPFEQDFDAAVRGWKTVGVDHLALGSMMKDCTGNLEAWLSGVKRLAAVGAKLREEGIRFAYHTHAPDFQKYKDDPRRKIDIMLESAPAKDLMAEFDVAWVYVGSVNSGCAGPADYLRKYKGRTPVIHVKDLKPMKKGGKVQFTPVGQGVQNWKEIFAAAHESGVEWFAYEQDNGQGGSPFDWARQSLEFMTKNI
jgi:sugar phosphate isomerase/epimerase